MSLIFGAPFVGISMLGFPVSVSLGMGVVVMVMSGRQADGVAGVETLGGEPLLDLGRELSVARNVDLARTTAGPLARDHGATFEDFAAPDTPGLVPLDRAGEALDAQRAVPAERLGQFQLGRGVREPEVRVELPTGQVCLELDAHVEWGQRQTHKARSPLSLIDLLDRRAGRAPAGEPAIN